MRYREENLVENSVNEGRRGWDLEDIAGDSLTVTVGNFWREACTAMAITSGQHPC
jgi:hypothetical protein